MKRYIVAALLALCAFALAGCAGKSNGGPAGGAQGQPDVPASAQLPPASPTEPAPLAQQTETVCGDLVIPVPNEYADLVTIFVEPEPWNEHWTPLASISEKASVEAFEHDHPGEDWGVGWLCSVLRLDRIGFEEWASGDDTGGRLFARDDNDCYYLLSIPTDVRFYRSESSDGAQDTEQWRALNLWVESLPGEIIARNGLTAYSAAELFEYDYTYEGEHVELGCRFPGEPLDLIILSLSQPVRRGEGGIWCVERVSFVYSEYDWTDPHLVFPAAFGVDEAAADYYARMQAECDAGQHPGLLTPRGAALDYAKRAAWRFGEDVSESDFEEIRALG